MKRTGHKISFSGYIFILAISLLILSLNVAGQDIKVLDDKSNAGVELNDFEQVRDVNGEICTLVIISSRIPGIKFYSNMGVEKVVYDSTGYKVWIPAKSTLLKFVVPDFPLYEHELLSDGNPTVWILILIVPEREIAVEYQDPEFNKVTIETYPANGLVFEEERLIGETPISLTHFFNESSPQIEIKKWGYKTEVINPDTLEVNRNYTLNFQKLSHQKGIFVMANIGQTWDFSLDYDAPVYGFSTGYIGRLGFFGSFGGTKYIHHDKYDDENTREVRIIKFSLGSLIALTKSSNIHLGLGYIDKEIRIVEDDQTVEDKGVFIDLGLVFRTNSPLLILLQSDIYYLGKELSPNGVSAGLGWAF